MPVDDRIGRCRSAASRPGTSDAGIRMTAIYDAPLKRWARADCLFESKTDIDHCIHALWPAYPVTTEVEIQALETRLMHHRLRSNYKEVAVL